MKIIDIKKTQGLNDPNEKPQGLNDPNEKRKG
jgi:hypothetical protein